MAGKQKNNRKHLRKPEFGDEVEVTTILVRKSQGALRYHDREPLDSPVSGKLVSISVCYDGIVESDYSDYDGTSWGYFTKKLTHRVATVSIGLRRKLIKAPLSTLKIGRASCRE